MGRLNSMRLTPRYGLYEKASLLIIGSGVLWMVMLVALAIAQAQGLF